MRRVLLVIALSALTAAGCAPVSVTEVPSFIVIRTTPTVTPTPRPTPGPVEMAVVEKLAENLRLPESEISVVRSEAVEFSDSCLDVTLEGVMCLQVTMSGRLIVLEAKGIQYKYHTNEDGSRIQPATPALIWKREGGIAGFCDTLTVFRSGEVYGGSCKQSGRMGTLAELLSAEEQAQFNDWIADLARADLDASDPRGVSDRMVVGLRFFGAGTTPPTKSEQQELFSFAQNLYQELVQ